MAQSQPQCFRIDRNQHATFGTSQPSFHRRSVSRPSIRFSDDIQCYRIHHRHRQPGIRPVFLGRHPPSNAGGDILSILSSIFPCCKIESRIKVYLSHDDTLREPCCILLPSWSAKPCTMHPSKHFLLRRLISFSDCGIDGISRTHRPSIESFPERCDRTRKGASGGGWVHRRLFAQPRHPTHTGACGGFHLQYVLLSFAMRFTCSDCSSRA